MFCVLPYFVTLAVGVWLGVGPRLTVPLSCASVLLGVGLWVALIVIAVSSWESVHGLLWP